MRTGVVVVWTLVLSMGALGCGLGSSAATTIAEETTEPPTEESEPDDTAESCQRIPVEESGMLGDGAWTVDLISDEPLRGDWELYSPWPDGVAAAAGRMTVLVEDWAQGFVVWLYDGQEARRVEVDAGELLQPADIVAVSDGFLLLVNQQDQRDGIPQLWWSDDGVSWFREDTSDGWFRAATAVEMVRRDDTVWIAGGIATGRNVSSPSIWTRRDPGTLELASLEDSREPVTFVSGFESTCSDLLAHGFVTLNPNLAWRLDDQSEEWRLTATPASTFDDELRLLASSNQVTIGIGTKQRDLLADEEQVIASSTDSAKSWDRVSSAEFAVDGEPVPPDNVSLLFGTSRAVWALAEDPRTSDDGQVADVLLWTVNGRDWNYTDGPEWPINAQIVDLMERNEGLAIVAQSALGVHLWTWAAT